MCGNFLGGNFSGGNFLGGNFLGAIFTGPFIIISKKLDQMVSKLLTLSKCYTCILITTFCFEMWNISEHALRYFIIDNNYKLLTFQQADVYLNEPMKIHELIKLANQSN